MVDPIPPGRGRAPLLILLLAFTVSACVPVYERRLAQHRAEGDLGAAGDLLASAAERDPADPGILRERGILAFERGDNEAAIATLEESLALDPEDQRTEMYLAAAFEKSGRFIEAGAHYRRAEALAGAEPVLTAALACQRVLVTARSLDDLVAARLAAEKAGDLPGGERLLILPFSVYGTNPEAMSLRLGLAAVASADWGGAPAAVPFPEVDAFLAALGVSLDGTIDAEVRERLARLTGARYVLDGQLSELRELVSLAPVFIDRGAPVPADRAAPGDAAPAAREVRLAYQQQHIGALAVLERELIAHVAEALAVELSPADELPPADGSSPGGESPPADETIARRGSARSGQAIALYGEAIGLERSGDPAAAAERLAQATALDPEFALAREGSLRLASCRGVAGEPAAVLAAYERARDRSRDRDQERELLTGTTETASRIGGAPGEGDDYSINRSGSSGSAAFPVRLPR